MTAIRLTPRDVEVLRFLGRQRFATVPQLARWAARSEKKIYPRLCGLRAHELVEFRRPLVERGVYLATRSGLATAGLNLPPARVEIATFTHDRLVADLAVDLERAGAEVVTEREMRHRDEAGGPGQSKPRYAVVLPSGGRHYPDLVVALSSGRYEAVEVELTPKNRARRERILTGYARARHIDHVVYHVANPSIARLVASSAQRVGTADLLDIRALPEEPR